MTEVIGLKLDSDHRKQKLNNSRHKQRPIQLFSISITGVVIDRKNQTHRTVKITNRHLATINV